MLKKVSTHIATCLFGLCFLSIGVYAQEEGGVEEREGGVEERVEPIIIAPDSSTVEMPREGKIDPSSTDANKIPSDELLPTKAIKLNPLPTKPTPSTDGGEKVKPKEGKSDISFNIFHYIFYKFRQVDVAGA